MVAVRMQINCQLVAVTVSVLGDLRFRDRLGGEGNRDWTRRNNTVGRYIYYQQPMSAYKLIMSDWIAE